MPTHDPNMVAILEAEVEALRARLDALEKVEGDYIRAIRIGRELLKDQERLDWILAYCAVDRSGMTEDIPRFLETRGAIDAAMERASR
jgi:hypothetical protein